MGFIMDKVDKIFEMVSEMKVTLARVEVDLAHHIKRSDQHEERLDKQRNTINKLWIVIAALVGGAVGNEFPAIMKLLGGLI